ncbi:MAG: hypothetical protein GOMPHAMPRED_007846 [Gomphillus americanus]|uniref:Uncharacterized protein n=1 Tax=Gomphillus americanus TaxID=1940652 RepID=A0A8H3IA99_9LECA|nr:MAG: hypothetical protein GOMPHAMPRED_007846 [Gomphillus americanus]
MPSKSALQNVRLGKPGSAPPADLYFYRHKEAQKGSALSEPDFDPRFLVWAQGHLGLLRSRENFQAGKSLMNEISAKVKKNLANRAALREELKTMQKGLDFRAGFVRDVKVSSDRGKSRNVSLTTKFHLTDIWIPFHKQDTEAIRQLEYLQVSFKAEFVDETRATLASSLAHPSDPCYQIQHRKRTATGSHNAILTHVPVSASSTVPYEQHCGFDHGEVLRIHSFTDA